LYIRKRRGLKPPGRGVFVNATHCSPLVFRGGAYSPDFGLGEMGDVLWSSNLDGLLGRGFELVTEDLTAGVHAITMTVPDGLGGTTTAHVSIRVTSQA
jgi:hypothetical protein